MLPDSNHVQATQSGLLPLHHSLSTTAKTAHVLDGMTNLSLISIGQLCDDNCVAILDKQRLQVFKNNKCILMGPRHKTDGLWDVVLPLPTTSVTPVEATPVEARANLQINAIICKDTSKMQLITYLYGCCCSPKTSTWKKAIKNGNFITWPGIDNLSINAHLEDSVDSVKGHLDQERKNLQQSTCIKLETDETNTTDETDEDHFLLSDMPNIKTFEACAMLIPFTSKNTAYHGLTGRFPHRSSRGQ
jgi:hypothetical protein